ncbi:unnamed protein product [Meganyctiphanes norvegica]|uniref:C2H2-type domain-containing protein n=1 Tax=Meganyctiphanes norvegica TaxID=48144 RepID=A0AAV2RA59_MEGNR
MTSTSSLTTEIFKHVGYIGTTSSSTDSSNENQNESRDDAIDIHNVIYKLINNREKLLSNDLENVSTVAESDGKETFKCTKCDESFEIEVELERHSLTHQQLKYECYKCPETFDKVIELVLHIQAHDIEDISKSTREYKSLLEISSNEDSFSKEPFKEDDSDIMILEDDNEPNKSSLIIEHSAEGILIKGNPNSNTGSQSENDDCIAIEDDSEQITEKQELKCFYCNHRSTNPPEFNKHFQTHFSFLNNQEDKSCLGEKNNMIAEEEYINTNEAKNSNSLSNSFDEKKDFPQNSSQQFNCQDCNYIFEFIQLGNLKIQIKIYKNGYNEPCDICRFKCFKIASINANSRYRLLDEQQSTSRDKPFACPHCDYRARISQTLQQHIRTHSEYRPFACLLCPYRAKLSKTLEQHMRSHMDIRPFACPHCEYRAKLSQSLTKHILTHNSERPFPCPQCNYRAKSVQTLKIHFKTHLRIHDGPPILKETMHHCTFCDYKTRHNSSLEQHMRTHTGERPFACPHCDYKAALSQTLITHIRTHTGERPFICTFCDYKASQKSSLKAHIRIHTGERPYACPHCDYKCQQRSYLKKHIKIKHDKE